MKVFTERIVTRLGSKCTARGVTGLRCETGPWKANRAEKSVCRARLHVVSIAALMLLSLLSTAGHAQEQVASLASHSNSLPAAPVPKPATVSGTVLDSSGAAIPGAQVSLLLPNGSRLLSVTSDANGDFSFTDVAPGSYVITVEASGFTPFRTPEFTVAAQQVYSLPAISLSVARQTASVVVRPTEEIAAEQLKAEEKQRIFGIFPEFYTSFIPDAAPLTSNQKLSLAARDSFDPVSFMLVSVTAGIQQANNAHKGYGQGAAGYEKRWGAAFVDQTSADLLSHYVFASLLHQDPRYFYQGTGTKKSRLFHALSYSVVARSDRGKTMFNYSYLLGDLCAGALSNAYYPRADRGANLVFTNAAIGIAGRAGLGLFREFVAPHLTKNLPDPNSTQGTQQNAPPRLNLQKGSCKACCTRASRRKTGASINPWQHQLLQCKRATLPQAHTNSL